MSFLLVALIGSAAEVTDVLTNVSLGVDQSSYTNFSNKKATSEALYSGKIGGSSGAINFRGGTNQEGLVTTVSGGKISKIVLTWASGYTTTNRPIVVYAKNEAYASQTELYSTATRGTEIYNASIDVNNKTVTIIPDGEYTYVGFACGNSKYIAFDKIEITWSDGAAETDVKTPTFSLKEDTYYEAQQVIIATETEGASITYSVTKNDVEFVASTTAVAPVTVELPMDAAVANYVITAKASKEGMTESAEVSATYTLNPNKPAARMFVMVNDASEIAAGDKVIFVAQQVKDGGYQGDVAMGGSAGKYGMVEHVTVVEGDVAGHGPFKGVIHGENTMNVHVFEVDGDASGYTFQDEADQTYISSTNGNGLYWTTTVSNEEKWTLSNLTEGVTVKNVAYADRVLKYNPSSPRFATYTSGQKDVLIFKHSVELSGVESNVAEEAAVINTVAGGVDVAVSEPTIASVYTVSGQLVANQVVDATAVISLANGFYIVKVGNTVKKVIVR